MKSLLVFCLAVYLLAEVSARPTPQFLDRARELFETAKEKAQDAMEQAQEAATRAFETAKTAIQNGLNSAQQNAQLSKFGFGENLTTKSSGTELIPTTAAA